MWSLTIQVSLRTDQISQTKVDEEIVEQRIDIVDQMVRLPRTLLDSSSNINTYDKETLEKATTAAVRSLHAKFVIVAGNSK